MSNKSTIVALALLVLLASCACLGAFASWTLNNAMGQAATIAEETTAHTEQTTVQICAGLFNVGSCRTRQSSTATAPRPAAADDLGPNPWPLIVPLSVVLMTVVFVMLRGLAWLDGER
ncbi:MAG: hypothetical protein HONDAALG_03744 [Gammaproteobacteria bacterium]|nr:hypothetical protein [Gammaproteobacteria bacterium]